MNRRGIRFADDLERHQKVVDQIAAVAQITVEIPGLLDTLETYRLQVLPAMGSNLENEELFNPDPECLHRSDPDSWDGAKCMWCSGWFCY